MKKLSLIYALVITIFANPGLLLAVPPQIMNVKLENPLAFTDLTDLFEAILEVVIVLATPVIIFFVIYAGFLYVTARGNAEQVQQATRALLYAVIGGVIVLGAFAMMTIIGNLVGAFIN